jgi:predicted RNA polymerase sigma factor
MARGPGPGLALLEKIGTDGRMARDYRLPAVRGRLLEMEGDTLAAIEAYRKAAGLATNLAQQRALNGRADRLALPAPARRTMGSAHAAPREASP